MITRKYILSEADKIVNGVRDNQYGNPEDNFKIISRLWSAYLSANDKEILISPLDVAMMMSLLKIARIKTGAFKDDNFIDLAGYSACGGEIASKREYKASDSKNGGGTK